MDGANYVGEGEPYNEVTIRLRYGHPSGMWQAYHSPTGSKQLGETPTEAVNELLQLLRGGRVVRPIYVATCPCGDYNTKDSLDDAVAWGELHEEECGAGEVHVAPVEP